MTAAASTCPSHFLLDQWTLGELEHDARLQLERHVEHCPRCQARQAQRRASEADFVVDVTTLRALQQPAASAQPTHEASASWLVRRTPRVITFAAAAAACVFAITSGGLERNDARVDDDIAAVRAKGGPQSALFVQDERGVRGLFLDDAAAPALVHSGDTLQVAVTSATAVFVGVLSRDAVGHVSTYVATSEQALVRVSAGRNVPLPQATTLDDVVGHETVAVFTCDAAIHTPALEAFVLDGEPPTGCRVDRYQLDKRAGR
jgi:hypothetical protein